METVIFACIKVFQIWLKYYWTKLITFQSCMHFILHLWTVMEFAPTAMT